MAAGTMESASATEAEVGAHSTNSEPIDESLADSSTDTFSLSDFEFGAQVPMSVQKAIDGLRRVVRELLKIKRGLDNMPRSPDHPGLAARRSQSEAEIKKMIKVVEKIELHIRRKDELEKQDRAGGKQSRENDEMTVGEAL